MAKVTYVEIDVDKPVRPLVGASEALVELRRKMVMGQVGFAHWLGVSQSVVAKWETGARPIPYKVVLQLARSVTDPHQREFWSRQAGIKDTKVGSSDTERTREIPLLKDAAAAGTPRALNEKEIEDRILLPASWVPGRLACAIKVDGDSMSPILESGFIVLVDTTVRDPEMLLNKMILAREDDGVTIKWLRRDGEAYMLVPENRSPRHQVRIFKRGRDLAIVGQVVKWIGTP